MQTILSWRCSVSVRVSGRLRIHLETVGGDGGRAVTGRGEVRFVQVSTDALVAALVAERHDLLPQLPGVGESLVPPAVQVGLVVIEDRGPVLPLAGEQFLRGGSVTELLDGPPGHAELTLDRAAAVPGLQQYVDGSVPGPGAVSEPMSGRPG
ncbi:hypothetical protein ACF07B_20545 [Streptomyces sp. NPDC015532]|uniref:hypothetical protein n=1 Tax=Streptomyces sp. NPDC015532 TaxID=3364960 RepID=UPI0036FE8220